MYQVDDVKLGDTVFLHAHTKTAPPECYRGLQAMVSQPPAKFWPHLVVEWEERNGEGRSVSRWLRVHKDDVKKKPGSATTVADKRQGDTSGGTTPSKWQRKLAIATPVETIEGQESLF